MRSLVHNDHFCPLSSGITGTHGKRSLEHMDGEDTLGLVSEYHKWNIGTRKKNVLQCFHVISATTSDDSDGILKVNSETVLARYARSHMSHICREHRKTIESALV